MILNLNNCSVLVEAKYAGPLYVIFSHYPVYDKTDKLLNCFIEFMPNNQMECLS